MKNPINRFLLSTSILVFLIVNISCTTSPKAPEPKHHNLENQRLVKREIFLHGFTNQNGDSVIKYDLRDKAVRDKLIFHGFVCIAGGKRYRIASNSAALRRTTCKKVWRSPITKKFKCWRKKSYLLPIEQVPEGVVCRAVKN